MPTNDNQDMKTDPFVCW